MFKAGFFNNNKNNNNIPSFISFNITRNLLSGIDLMNEVFKIDQSGGLSEKTFTRWYCPVDSSTVRTLFVFSDVQFGGPFDFQLSIKFQQRNDAAMKILFK